MRIAIVLAVLVMLAGPARSGLVLVVPKSKFQFEVVMPTDAGDVPKVIVKLDGSYSADQIRLVDERGTPITELHPLSVQRVVKEKVAVALVVSTWEIWMGNDDVVPEDDPSRRLGALKELRATVDNLSFGKLGAPGSVGMIVGYSDRATLLMPPGPLAELTGAKLGTQRDFYGRMGVELVAGIRMAMAELRKVSAERKLLIVIGDGNDTNNDGAKLALTQLGKEARNDGITPIALVYKGTLSDPGHVIGVFAPDAQSIATFEQGAQELERRLPFEGQTTVTFVGYRHDRPGLVWDGKPRDLYLRLNATEKGPRKVTARLEVILPEWKPPVIRPSRGFPWLLAILGGVGLLGLVAGGLALNARRQRAALRA